jgi:hypothetical protein
VNLSGADWLLLAGSAVMGITSFLAARYTGRSSVDVAKVGADEGAFVRAEGIYKNAIARLEQERAEDRARIVALELAVRQLKARLVHEGIDVSDLALDI